LRPFLTRALVLRLIIFKHVVTRVLFAPRHGRGENGLRQGPRALSLCLELVKYIFV
jgi:hypothetical protein